MSHGRLGLWRNRPEYQSQKANAPNKRARPRPAELPDTSYEAVTTLLTSWVSSRRLTIFKDVLVIYFRMRRMGEGGADVVEHWTARRRTEVKFPGQQTRLPSLLPEALLLASRILTRRYSPSAFCVFPRQNTAPSHAGCISPRLRWGSQKRSSLEKYG